MDEDKTLRVFDSFDELVMQTDSRVRAELWAKKNDGYVRDSHDVIVFDSNE
jgi:hypothetical protein